VEPKTHGLLKRRPLWLMSQPQRLGSGLKEIQLTSEMERIEGGWWDGFDIRRDYYRARDRHGRRLWLFRNLQDGEWYLQGLFG
ncbi:MAG: DNA polymerase Y family protein, partial [Candidatus Thiodiazotropha taylori]|nr:DNA polymerase Y family protein [Candidatus Thiodiazotropha taylori]